jgi:tetratricopeptide (TPR) repeat protein
MKYDQKILNLYKNKKNYEIINILKNSWYSKSKSVKKKILFSNLLACSYINIGNVDEAITVYDKAANIIKNFDGPDVHYNIGILPNNILKTDRIIGNYIIKKFNKKLNKKKIKDLINSLKINPNVKGKYHSNLGLTLINLNKIVRKIESKNNNEIFYLNIKYNTFRAEKLLKNKKFVEFKKEVKQVLKYNPVNMRMFSVISYAIQKYNLKDLEYFCKNPFDYVMEFNLLKKKFINKKNIENINSILSRQSQYDSYQPGSVYLGYKSLGNLFETPNIEIQNLKKKLFIIVKEYLKFYQNNNEIFIKKFPKKKIIKSWYIRIKKGGGIDYHIHNSWLSAVMYTQLPRKIKGGKLDLSIINWGFKKEKKFIRTVNPALGKLVIFPSSLPHKVTKFDHNKYRISIAFDIIPG